MLTAYGAKYMVRGTVRSPTGILFLMVSVWMVRDGEDVPRFVTAYPGGKTT